MGRSRVFVFVLGVAVVAVFLVIVIRKRPGPENLPVGQVVPPRQQATLSAEEVIAECRSMGHIALADRLKEAALPCFHFVSQPIDEANDEAASCTTRFGGRPNLPDSDLWPRYKGKSLSFVAQVNLAEIPSESDRAGLSQSGMLYFFYETDQSAWGFDPKDKGAWRVIYVENIPAELPLLDFPPDLPDEAKYAEIRMKFQQGLSIPEPEEVYDIGRLTDKEQDAVYELYGRYSEYGPPKHQFLGEPMPVQGSGMDLDCQLASHGLYCGDETGYADPRAKALEAGAKDWRLLLQVDSDDEAGMMWGDGGRLYFWIREEDLRSRRFDQAWMVLQCG